ncbi:MAG TPA: ATP-binding protein [Gemmatimonadaceae bacterium]|nr:ATP-binding protein [Gemmatimonadaceae bacterium]
MANPCNCCYLGHPTRACTCSEAEILNYRSRLSGALADRIEMHVTLAPVHPESLESAGDGESSSSIRARVELSRAMQRVRFTGTAVTCDSQASGRQLIANGNIGREARAMIRAAMESLSLSGGGYHHVIRVARTIADLADCEKVCEPHVAEALRFRPR